MPLFVSHRRLNRRGALERGGKLPEARTSWALDSGGFTELSLYGEWRTTPAAYIDAVRRYQESIGLLDWCAPQDWMVEPFMLAKTGLSVAEHQARTIASYAQLGEAGLPVIPVLQGWTLADYHRHVDDYARAGLDLDAAPVVGLGSVCRRQASEEVAAIVWSLHERGLRLHGFGVKALGLDTYYAALSSCDSLAWSYNARRNPPHPDCTHESCQNCPRYAMRWRSRLIARVARKVAA